MKQLRTEKRNAALLRGEGRFCGVVAAVVGSTVVGGIMSSNASKNASQAAANSALDSTNAQERVAQAQLDFAKQQDADNKIRNAKADALTEQVANKQLAAMDQNMALAKDYDDYNKGTFRPLEKSIVEEAQNYDTPEAQEKAAGEASAAVKQSLAQSSEATARAQARMGVNPNSGRAQVTQSEAAVTGALGEASAENTARTSVKTLGAAKRMDAASLGRNLPSAQAAAAGLGIQAGNAAVGNTATTNNAATAGANSVGGLYGSAGSTFGSASNNFNNVSNSANNAAAASSAAWGQIGGMGIKLLAGKAPASGAVANVLY